MNSKQKADHTFKFIVLLEWLTFFKGIEIFEFIT